MSPGEASATFEFELMPEDILQAQLALHRAQGKVAWRLPRWRQTAARANAGALQHTVVTLTADGVQVGQSDAQSQALWARFEAAVETDELFVLVSRGHASFIPLPKRGIATGELDTVRNLVGVLPQPARSSLTRLRAGLIMVVTTVGTVVFLALVTGTWRL